VSEVYKYSVGSAMLAAVAMCERSRGWFDVEFLDGRPCEWDCRVEVWEGV
jgi:hypothetical protein